MSLCIRPRLFLDLGCFTKGCVVWRLEVTLCSILPYPFMYSFIHSFSFVFHSLIHVHTFIHSCSVAYQIQCLIIKRPSLAAERLLPTGGTTDFWPRIFHATPIGLMLKSRIQPGGGGGARFPSGPPVPSPMAPIYSKKHLPITTKPMQHFSLNSLAVLERFRFR